MSSLAKHVIRRPRPYRCVLAMVIAIILSLGGFWLFMQKNSLREVDKLTQENERLSQQCNGNDIHTQQLKELNEQLTLKAHDHQSELKIQTATTAQLQVQLEELQQQLTSLNKEVLFYQSITQGDGTKKLHIRNVQLFATPDDSNLVRYRIIITQGQKINKAITGTVKVLISKEKEGQGESSLLAEHPLNLLHVQLLEGQLKIADDITPLSVIIELQQNEKTTLSQTFDWQITPNN